MTSIVSLLNTQTAAEVVNALYICAWCLLMATLLYGVNGMRVRRGRSAAFAALMAAAILLPDRFFPGFILRIGVEPGSWQWNVLYATTHFSNPLWLVSCVLLAVFLLRIPWRNIKNQLVVLFCVIQLYPYVGNLVDLCFWLVVTTLGIQYSPDSLIVTRAHLFAELLVLINMLILLAAWSLARRYIKANQHKIKLLAERSGTGQRRRMALDCAQIIVLWLATVSYMLTNSITSAYFLVALQFGFAIVLLILDVLVVYLKYNLRLREMQAANLMESNRMMLETIDNFRDIKHDFNNILQTYDGFFELEDYERLKVYHSQLRGVTIAAGDRLALQQTFAEQPAILGLLLGAMDYAGKQDVAFSLLHEERLAQIDIPAFELCRALGILLNNAIEHAAQTRARSASLSVQSKPDGTAVVIISNATDGKVDTANLFKDGYTTKPGHMGRGLSEVNQILAQFYGCTVLPHSSDDSFSMYINAPMSQTL